MRAIDDMPQVGWLGDDQDRENKSVARANELLDRELANAWAGLLSSEPGRMVAWAIFDQCHILSTSYTGNAASNFLEGERSVGLKLLKQFILPHDPHLFTQMMVEAEERFIRLTAVADAEIEQMENDNA